MPSLPARYDSKIWEDAQAAEVSLPEYPYNGLNRLLQVTFPSSLRTKYNRRITLCNYDNLSRA
ncbi:hypothetical protein BDN70DRAFT_885818 [Pholiota conissans]|uniref:Uncharacterized protein n=1 Tax=Pholiota conissans TaxID=109636 RepID=A0A9P5YTF5_9AGAR|nr:hypothetical protein BDN70DRAFT_885818 [Pholiota conissans]